MLPHAGKGVLGWVPSRIDWRSASQQSTPDWKIRSASLASAPGSPDAEPKQAAAPSPGKPPLPRPGSAVRAAASALGAVSVGRALQGLDGGLPPDGLPVLATPRDVKVVLGNKAMLAAEGISVPRPVDDYMRDMEVHIVPEPYPYMCTCTACLQKGSLSAAARLQAAAHLCTRKPVQHNSMCFLRVVSVPGCPELIGRGAWLTWSACTELSLQSHLAAGCAGGVLHVRDAGRGRARRGRAGRHGPPQARGARRGALLPLPLPLS